MAVRCKYNGVLRIQDIFTEDESNPEDEPNPEFCLYTTSWRICKANSGNRDPRERLLKAVDYKYVVGIHPYLE